MKTQLIIIILSFAAFCLSAQEVVSTAGETQNAGNYEISWTLGETVIETVSSGTTTLTQGFHQTKLTVTAIDEITTTDLKVYPNPTSEFVIISSNKLDDKSSYSLFNLSGKLLENKIISTSETRVNLKNYASGTYLLKLQYKPNQSLQTYKIVKK